MAEFEVLEEMFADVEDGIASESENISKLDLEESEAFSEEVSVAKESVSKLSQVASEFKEFALQSYESLKTFGVFVTKNMIIGSIFYGVNLLLTTMVSGSSSSSSSSEQESNTKMLEVVKAITQLIQSETDLCTSIKDWLTDHQDETVTLDGIEIKMESVFESKLQPISDAVDEAYSIATTLMTKVDENISWNVPTADDISNLLVASDAFLAAFEDLRSFAEDNSDKVSALESLLEILSQSAIDEISTQLDTVKKMSLY